MSSGLYSTITISTLTTNTISNIITTTSSITTNSINASIDRVAQGIYLTPSPANSIIIQQYFQKVVNTVTASGSSPFWANNYKFSTGVLAVSNTNLYQGGILMRNGNIALTPSNSNTTVTIYNPTTNTTYNSVGGPGYSCAGAVLLPSGNVLFTGFNAANLSIYNPITNICSSIAVSLRSRGNVLLPNGNVLMANPGGTAYIYNPNTNASVQVGSAGASYYYGCGVLLANGNTLLVPASFNGLYPVPVAIYNTTSGVSYPGPYLSVNTYNRGILLPNGNVLFTPIGTTTPVTVYNINTNTFTSASGPLPGNNAYYSGVLLPDGKVLLIPWGVINFGIYNYITNVFSTIASGLSTAPYYSGGVLLPNGNVVLVPGNGLLSIDIFSTNLICPLEFCLSPYFNKV